MIQMIQNFIDFIPVQTRFFLSLWFMFVLLMYFVPWMIAHGRSTRNRAQVRVINIFLWRTFIGRVVALAMAFSPDVEEFKKEEINPN